VILIVIITTGCGGQRSSGDGAYDPRDARVSCLAGEGLPARKLGADLVIVDSRPPLRIFFAATPGEAEAMQVRGHAQGAEQLGRALLYVGAAPEALLDRVEGCLDD
jgi:hypothetical protein